jgi:ketosteroid isomerase-like protein/quercetin dioxygenase-like cupin family protein
MKRTLAVLAIAAVSQLASAQSKDERAIRAQGEEWQRAVNAGEVDKILAIHKSDAVYMMSHQPLIRGAVAIRSGWSEAVKLPNYRVHWTPTKIDVASPRVATEYGTYTESYKGPDGKMITDGGNYVTIWNKVNGKWLVALDAPNTTSPLPAAPEMPATMAAEQLTPSSTITWMPLTVPGFDPGTQLAVINGDPTKSGEYTLRLKFPAGYRFPVHWHPGAENLTVLSGGFLFAPGASADWSQVKTYGPGDYIYMPARHPHFGGAQTETIVELHGIGPFAINLGTPK